MFINKMLENRWLTYGVVVLFAIDGLTRLVDGRVLRGVANLVAGAAILVTSERRRLGLSKPRGAGEVSDENAARRRSWGRAHPVLLALALGAVWGSSFAAYLALTNEGPIALAAIVGLGSGLLLFGPGVVFLTRRIQAKDVADAVDE